METIEEHVYGEVLEERLREHRSIKKMLHACQAITTGRYFKKGKQYCGVCNKQIK